MDKHRDEEYGVEVGDDGRGADACAPGEAHDPVGDVVGLAAVRPPAGGEQLVAGREEEFSSRLSAARKSRNLPMLRLDVRRVLDRATWQLREGPAVLEDALSLHLEAALLRHGRVPNVVRGEERRVERNVGGRREAVLGRVVGGHVDDGVNVRLRRSIRVS